MLLLCSKQDINHIYISAFVFAFFFPFLWLISSQVNLLQHVDNFEAVHSLHVSRLERYCHVLR
jgi:ABC-type glycerol-3-phosphate transport system permease component